MKLFKLIRYKNILFIVLIQYITRVAIVKPYLDIYGLEPATSWLFFIALILSTAAIAAGGYVINDYFDTRIDEINRPERVIIGKTVSRQRAMMLHQALTVIGVLAGLAMSWKAHSIPAAFIILFIPGLLWFYSSVYKRQFFIGNIIVAFSCGMVPMMVVIVESFMLKGAHGIDVINMGITSQLLYFGMIFSIFAFITTLIREIVKDFEDEIGDRDMECNTLPIVAGPFWAKTIVISLSVFTLLLLNYYYFKYFPLGTDSNTLFYQLTVIQAPFIYFMYIVAKAKHVADYKKANAIIKFIMLAGTLFAIPIYLFVSRTYQISFF